LFETKIKPKLLEKQSKRIEQILLKKNKTQEELNSDGFTIQPTRDV